MLLAHFFLRRLQFWFERSTALCHSCNGQAVERKLLQEAVKMSFGGTYFNLQGRAASSSRENVMWIFYNAVQCCYDVPCLLLICNVVRRLPKCCSSLCRNIHIPCLSASFNRVVCGISQPKCLRHLSTELIAASLSRDGGCLFHSVNACAHNLS